MQKRSRIRIALLFGMLGISALLWKNINKTTDISHDLFALKNPQSVTRITFSPNNSKQSYLVIEKIQGRWMVRNKNNTYPADTLSVNQLLFWAMPHLQVKSPIPDAMKDMVTKDIGLNGTKVIFSKGDQEIHTFFVGYASATQESTYMYFPETERPCEITLPGFAGYLTPYFNTNIDLWRSIFLVETSLPEITSLHVIWPNAPETSFTIKQDVDKTQLFNEKNQLVKANQSLMAGYLDLCKTLPREAGELAGINKNKEAANKIRNAIPMVVFEYTFTHAPKQIIYLYRMDLSGETYSLESRTGDLKSKETELFWAHSSYDKTLWVVQEIVLRNRLRRLENFSQSTPKTLSPLLVQ